MGKEREDGMCGLFERSVGRRVGGGEAGGGGFCVLLCMGDIGGRGGKEREGEGRGDEMGGRVYVGW